MLFFRSQSQERLGEILILFDVLLTALFPILVHYGSGRIPAIFYAALTSLIAGGAMMAWLGASGRIRELANQKAWVPMLFVTLCIVVFPSVLIYKGTELTSGINTSILLTAEIFFALLFFHYAGERITRTKITGAVAMVIGTVLVVWNGQLALSAGDLFIVLATAFYPVGNFYAKKALKEVHPLTIVFVRTFLGGLILMGFSLSSESIVSATVWPLLKEFWWILLLNGIAISAISKVIWYEGLKRIEVTKATIMVMSYPALSMILATIFLKEIPTFYQLGGLVIIFTGLYGITRNPN